MSEATTKQITKNCHYISRFITKPWEFEDRPGKGQLCYYDFDTDTFRKPLCQDAFRRDGPQLVCG